MQNRLLERTNVTCQFIAMYCVDICRIPLRYQFDDGEKEEKIKHTNSRTYIHIYIR